MSDDKKNRKLTAEDILLEYEEKLSGSSAEPEVPAPDIIIGDDEDAITVIADIREEDSEEIIEIPVDPDFEDDGISVISDEEEKPLRKEPEVLYDPDEYEPDEIDLFTGFDEIIPDPQDRELSSAYFEEDEDSIDIDALDSQSGEERSAEVCNAEAEEKSLEKPEVQEQDSIEESKDAEEDKSPEESEVQEEESAEKSEEAEEDKSPEEHDAQEKESAEESKDAEEGNTSEEPKKKSRFRDLFPQREDSTLEIIRKIVFLAATTVFIVAGVMLAVTLIQSKRALDLKNNLTSELEQFEVSTVTSIDENGNVIEIEPTQEQQDIVAMDKLAYLKSKNPNTVGYLTMSGVDVYEPILQADDNSYYLRHAFDGTENKAGAVFLDYRAEISADRQSDMLVLYGHNQRDGTMFGNLKHYKRNVDFYKRNPFITFETEYGSQKYVIFAYFVTNTLEKHDSNGEVFHYHDYPELYSEEVYTWYMSQVAKRNEIISPIDVTYGDKFLVLSTCSNEYSDSRFVVMARKLRAGEDPDEIDFSATRINYGSEEIDWYAITSDMTTTVDSEAIEISIHQSMADEWFATIGEALQSLHDSNDTVSETAASQTVVTTTVTEPPANTSNTVADTVVPEVSESSSAESSVSAAATSAAESVVSSESTVSKTDTASSETDSAASEASADESSDTSDGSTSDTAPSTT